MINACACIVVVSDPVPVRVRVTVVGLVHPEARVVLPLSSGARPTTVMAGELPGPWEAMVVVKGGLSAIADSVGVTLAHVLDVLKQSDEPPSWFQPAGPAPPQ